MSGEPQQVREAREAIAKLLEQLHPPPSAEWIEERTTQLMFPFVESAPDDPPTKPL